MTSFCPTVRERAALRGLDQRRVGHDGDDLGERAHFDDRVDAGVAADLEHDAGARIGLEARHADGEHVVADGQQAQGVLALAVGGGGARVLGAGVGGGDGGARDRPAGVVLDSAEDATRWESAPARAEREGARPRRRRRLKYTNRRWEPAGSVPCSAFIASLLKSDADSGSIRERVFVFERDNMSDSNRLSRENSTMRKTGGEP